MARRQKRSGSPEFEARVEKYFRRLSEDTGEEEESDSTEEVPAVEEPPATPPPFSPDFDSPNLRLLPEQ